MNKSLIFFGSGPVASFTLAGLADHFEFEAVITKPRPPHHRGSVPVLELATKLNLKTFTPSNKTELSDLFERTSFASPAGLVVDYGIIIEKPVIDAFPKGIINSHFSLLPQWRGADPITFAILSGQAITGVSLMLINEKLDEGPLLATRKIAIEPEETTPSLTDKLISLSNQMIIENVPGYLAGQTRPYPQPSEPVSYSRKLTKRDGVIDLSKPASTLEREVRAFAGWPRSRVEIFSHSIIVTGARVASSPDDGDLVLKCTPGYLEIKQLIAPSGRLMSGADFIRGYRR